jgi:hypothetical protein
MNKILFGGVAAMLLGAPALAETSGPQRDPLDPTNLRQTAQPIRGEVSSGNAFNPAISVIVDGAWYWDNVGGEAFEIIEEADGFSMGHGHSHGGGHDHGGGHSHGELDRGFNLREVEVAFSATVDPYFDAFVMLIFDEDEVEVEEAYLTTRGLPHGLQMKFGKFLSDIGYINKQHPHSWDFADRPLVNELLFGDHGLQETGVQLTWLAPTTQYLRVGVEALQGETEGVANYIGAEEEIEGTDRILDDKSGPRLFTGFAKFSPDLGFNHALQLGASYGYSNTFQQTIEHSTRFEDRDGSARFWGLDAVYKYTPAGSVGGQGAFKLQGEYFHRWRDLDRRDVYFACHPAGIDCDDPDVEWRPGDVRNEESFNEKQDGYYVQALYGLMPRWNAGARVEQVGLTNRTGRGDGEDWDDSRRYSAVLSFMPTEFSRLRLQYSRGDIAVDGEREKFNQVFLQFQMSLGVHGAHTF